MSNSESGRVLTPTQRNAVELMNYASDTEVLFFSSKTSHLLDQFAPIGIAQQIHSITNLLQPTKYQRRWLRRLMSFNFSREDAYELSLCSFGVALTRLVFSIDVFVTLDLRLIARFDRNLSQIEHRFRNLTRNIQLPYRNATLPVIVTPEDVLGV